MKAEILDTRKQGKLRSTGKYRFMRIPLPVLLCAGCLLLGGCESPPGAADIRVRAGMSRDDLKMFFGNPVRVEATANGGEDWYYRFDGWRSNTTTDSGASIGTGGSSSYVNASVELSNDTTEEPVHLSATGYVVEPIPGGKIVRN